MNTISWGIGFMVVGILGVWFTNKYPVKGRDIYFRELQGYVGGYGCILLGIYILWECLFMKH